MTLRAFIDAAYALMVRTYAAMPGKHLLEAMDLANESFGIEKSKEMPSEADNDASLKQLEKLMAGV